MDVGGRAVKEIIAPSIIDQYLLLTLVLFFVVDHYKYMNASVFYIVYLENDMSCSKTKCEIEIKGRLQLKPQKFDRNLNNI